MPQKHLNATRANRAFPSRVIQGNESDSFNDIRPFDGFSSRNSQLFGSPNLIDNKRPAAGDSIPLTERFTKHLECPCFDDAAISQGLLNSILCVRRIRPDVQNDPSARCLGCDTPTRSQFDRQASRQTPINVLG
jgi:hypothetical protein